jgi:hypothetical protein
VARAGEAKFSDFNNWTYEPRFEVTDILWYEPKTSTIQTMPMLVSKFEYHGCFYHCVGSYWAVEDGLSRDESQKDTESFLFPVLHEVLDTTVADKIAAIIQSNLPEKCPQKLKKQYTGKSIRQAAITTMLMDPESTFTDCAGRSGHASGTQLDSYEDKMNIAIAIRGGKILAGYRPNAECHVPSLNYLPSDDVARFEEKVFINDVGYFKPSGHLYPVLRTCLAVLIMHHNQVEKDLGPRCAIVMKLYQAAREAIITDTRYPTNTAPGVILQKWSELIMENFIAINPDIMTVSVDGSYLATATNQLSQIVVAQSLILARVEGKLDVLIREREKDKQHMTEQDKQISSIMNQLHAALEVNKDLSEKNILLRSAEKERPNDLTVLPVSQHPLMNTTMAQSAKRLAPMFSSIRQSLQKKPKADASTANITIAQMLDSLSSQGRLKHLTEWKEINLNSNDLAQKQSVKNVLELCQCVCSREESNALKDGCNGDRGKLLTTCEQVGKKAFKKMWEFEGVDDTEAEFKQNKALGSRGKMMTYNAVGIRVKDYKKSLVGIGCVYNSVRLGAKKK